MSLIPFVTLFVAAVTVYVIFRRSGQDALQHACDYLRHGALLIDVRSPAEFSSGHLPRAINLPLNELETLLPRYTRDKQQVLLVHCKSGMRSGLAAKRLKSQGYHNTFNLGSYSRASRLLSGS